jgi:hypothetical protein
MLLRKINAIVSLLCTFLILDHAIFNSVWMLSSGAIVKSFNITSWALAGLMLLHAFISIDLAVSAHMNSEKCECKSYPKMNLSTIVQRASGILLLVFTGLHIAGTVGYMKPPKIVHAIVPPLFFAIALIHTAVSTAKALITLGIGNARVIKIVDIFVKILCGVTLIACVIGFYLYLV